MSEGIWVMIGVVLGVLITMLIVHLYEKAREDNEEMDEGTLSLITRLYMDNCDLSDKVAKIEKGDKDGDDSDMIVE